MYEAKLVASGSGSRALSWQLFTTKHILVFLPLTLDLALLSAINNLLSLRVTIPTQFKLTDQSTQLVNPPCNIGIIIDKWLSEELQYCKGQIDNYVPG